MVRPRVAFPHDSDSECFYDMTQGGWFLRMTSSDVHHFLFCSMENQIVLLIQKVQICLSEEASHVHDMIYRSTSVLFFKKDFQVFLLRKSPELEGIGSKWPAGLHTGWVCVCVCVWARMCVKLYAASQCHTLRLWSVLICKGVVGTHTTRGPSESCEAWYMAILK